MKSLSTIFVALIWTALAPAFCFSQIDFNRDIRPILSNKCFACHGPDDKTREAGLRLDTFDGATEDAIVVGDPDESELIARVESDDDDEVMPPKSMGKPLSAREKELLRKWIHSGAKYSRHWSYVAPKRPATPTIEDEKFRRWKVNEIDAFTLAKMASKGLKPAEAANRYTIIRRLSLDLTGLPPSLDEVDAFLQDKSDNAYEKLVDRLMAKPAFGERWASVWLDLARYADSAGYAEDRRRTIWAFRDYVIRSLNANKPFDQFTIEQIAGDMLPNPKPEQLIATAFHRNTLTNSEGGTSDEEFRSAAVVDRVNTTLAVWMGTTMACAQCHNHKYDPISQKEYFEFYAFFNNTADNDRPNESPLFDVYREDQIEKRRKLVAELNDLKQMVNRFDSVDMKWIESQMKTLKDPKPIRGRYIRVELPDRTGILSLAEVQVFSGGKNIATQGVASQSSTDYAGPVRD